MLGPSWRHTSPSGQAHMASSSLGRGCLHALQLYRLHQGMRLAAQAPTLCWREPIQSHWHGVSQQKDEVLQERSRGSPALAVLGEVSVRRRGAPCLGLWKEHLQHLVQAQSSGWNDLQKGHSLGAVPLLPCCISWGSEVLLRGLFLLSLQKKMQLEVLIRCAMH